MTFSGHSKMLTQLLPHLNGHLRLVQSEELANLFLTKRLDLMNRVSRSTAELRAVTCKGPRLGPSLVFCPTFSRTGSTILVNPWDATDRRLAGYEDYI